MRCPYCAGSQSSVIDKRQVKSSDEIRRRRECLKCAQRFTTYERISEVERFVIKRDGRRQLYDKDKLLAGIEKALEKRPGLESLESIIEKVEKIIWGKGTREVESDFIGKTVLAELEKIDKVAYLRFASVYRKFSDPEDFTKELKSLHK